MNNASSIMPRTEILYCLSCGAMENFVFLDLAFYPKPFHYKKPNFFPVELGGFGYSFSQSICESEYAYCPPPEMTEEQWEIILQEKM